MLLKENQVVFHDYEWNINGDSRTPKTNIKLVSPFFSLSNSSNQSQTFRSAIRVMGNSFFDKFQTIVYLYVYNVQQFGVEVKAVECLVHGETICLETKFDESIMKVFKSAEFLTHDHLSDKGISLRYRIYMGTIQNSPVRSYGFELRDTRFGDELWSSAQKGYMTDCEFVVQRQTFLAHRFIVASRSPVLARRIRDTKNNNQISIGDDTNPAIFKALLYFLYTGYLLPVDTAGQRQLTALASKYQVKTLIEMHRSTGTTNQSRGITKLFLSVQPNMKPDLSVEIRESYGTILAGRRGLRLCYDYVRLFRPGEIVAPEVFRLDNQGFFGVTLTAENHVKNGRNYQLTFSSFNLISEFELFSVSYSKDGLTKTFLQKIFEEEKETYNIYRDGLSFPRHSDNSPYYIHFKFTVDLLEKSECWGYRLNDPLLPVHYWSTAKYGRFTDVNLRVGNKIFPAHRAVLSARSSVFCAMFNKKDSGFTSDPLGNFVKIDNMDPDIFQDFLVFVYTGRLRTSENLENLWQVADRFDIKTLERISYSERCRPRVEELIVTLLSRI